ncbi:hypothetical protein CPB83DRAFT_774674, partial [Crepidotus variabilis]
QVMERIQEVIKDTDTPSWIESVPLNFGEAAAGTLKADEWRTMSTIYLPIALISLWGDNNQYTRQIEATMFTSWIRAARLRMWLKRPDCPPALRECRKVFDKAFGQVDADQTPAASAFTPVPDHLRSLVQGPRIALRARHIVDNIVYSRESTHVGNSLIMFYPKGRHSNNPIPAIVKPDWVFTHYARWAVDRESVVILVLSRVSFRHSKPLHMY